MELSFYIRQYTVLCWKDFHLQLKRYVMTPLQLILPVVMILIVVFISLNRAKITKNPLNDTYFPEFDPVDSDIRYTGSQMNRPWYLACSPNNTMVDAIILSLYQKANGFFSIIPAFNSENEMVNEYMSNKSKSHVILACIVFDIKNTSGGGYSVTYKLRFPAEQHWKSGEQSSWLTDTWYGNFPSQSPRSNTLYKAGSITTPGYYREGFLLLQRYIDESIMNVIFKATGGINGSGESASTSPFQLKMFPYPSSTSDSFVDIIRLYLPLFLIISFVINTTVIAKDVTMEKEMKLKESMKLMGLRPWISWSAWFTMYFFFMLISITIMTFFLHIGTPVMAIFTYSTPSVTFVFLLLYTTSIIFFSFLMSAIFSKANVASATAAILYLLSYIPSYFIIRYYDSLSLGAKVGISFFNNIALGLGCMQFARLESMGVGLNWSNIGDTDLARDDMCMRNVMIMLAVDIILYAVLTWYFEAVCPGEFGVAQPFYFPFTYWYWFGNYDADQVEDSLPVDYGRISDSFEKPERNRRVGVRIRGLTKVFKKGQKPAVNSLNIDLYEGNITAFLGHNGAGKTTTMFMLTGFLKPTSGTALIGGFDINKQMDQVRQSLGLCPQHNILFGKLTVEQHLRFFAQLKGCYIEELTAEVDNMINMLHLEDKRHVEADSLSGGMKRKLSIAIALIAGSRFVILDEPTSGMDPESRRQMWEILQNQQRGRTIILSTHFMDEADLLGDRIAIVSGGEIQCYGSPVFLKDRYGIGYHMTIVKKPNCSAAPITELIKGHVRMAQFEGEMGAELTYLLPKSDSKKLSKLFIAIESNKEKLGIDSYGASITTMEEVFIKVAEESEKNENATNSANKIQSPKEPYTLPTPLNTERDVLEFQEKSMETLITNWKASQLHALFLKRIINTWRNRGVAAFQLFLPLIFVMLACIAIYNMPNKGDLPSLNLDIPSRANHLRYETPFYLSPGSSSTWRECLKKVFKGPNVRLVNLRKRLNTLDSLSNETKETDLVDNYLMKKAKEALSKYQMNYIMAVQVLPDKDTIRGYFQDEAYHSVVTTLNKISNMRLCRATHGTTALKNITFQINTINHPLPWIAKNTLVGQKTIEDILLGANIFSNCIAFGMGLAIGTFVLFLVNERVSGAKHSQMMSGVSPVFFWLTTLYWDFFNYMAPVGLILIVVAAFQTEGYVDNLGLVFALLVMYFWSLLPYVYCVSLYTSVASTGYIIVTVVNIFTGTVANLSLSIMKHPAFKIADRAYKIEWLFYTLFPNFCLNKGVYDIFFNFKSNSICSAIDNEYNLTQVCNLAVANNVTDNPCCPDSCGTMCLYRTSNYAGVEQSGIGRSLIFMAIQGGLGFIILFCAEYGIFLMAANYLHGVKVDKVVQVVLDPPPYPSSDDSVRTESSYLQSNPTSMNSPEIIYSSGLMVFEAEDSDVSEEKNRTLAMMTRNIEAGEHAIVLRNVTKSYRGFKAVDNLSLSVDKGECFGLLGVNGAGKTTTFKMMTGAFRATFGDIYIEGVNVAKNVRAAQSKIGYCPQFDALIDHMTVEETLYFYSRLRGIKSSALPKVVDGLVDILLLREHAKKLAGNLSGGNKRKLNVGIALAGNPQIIFLDEPTTGMDPAARRKLWNTLAAVRRSGKTIVLTSHSMEECEALCTRLAIMVNGKFKCLGSPQHLKSKFGGGYTVTVKLKQNKRQEITRNYSKFFIHFMDKVFPENVLKDQHESLLTFQIDTPNLTWGRIFSILEKSQGQLEVEDYSVSQTTLEQLFIHFAKSQRDLVLAP